MGEDFANPIPSLPAYRRAYCCAHTLGLFINEIAATYRDDGGRRKSPFSRSTFLFPLLALETEKGKKVKVLERGGFPPLPLVVC